MKTCTGCKEAKSEDQFGWRLGKRRSRCKPCEAEAERLRYKRDPSKLKARVRRIRKRNRQFLWDYLLDHPCIDCNEGDPVVLEFDHQGDKLSDISHLAHRTISIKRIQEEIDKCEVVCANCHRRRTAKTQGWYAALVS